MSFVDRYPYRSTVDAVPHELASTMQQLEAARQQNRGCSHLQVTALTICTCFLQLHVAPSLTVCTQLEGICLFAMATGDPCTTSIATRHIITSFGGVRGVLPLTVAARLSRCTRAGHNRSLAWITKT